MTPSFPTRLLAALPVALLLALAGQHPARASGDFTCSPSWTLAHDTFSACGNMAMLAPGNDTRVNLVLLLADLHPRPKAALVAPAGAGEGGGDDPLFDWPSLKARLFSGPGESFDGGYASGEGSRCRSNEAGTEGFEAVINAAPVPEAERAALIAARKGLAPTCADGSAGLPDGIADQVRSAPGKAFLAYLQGAQAFYAGNFADASARFAALGTADVPWLKETGRYMLGRVEVNRVQVGAFDDYGYPKGADAIAPALVAEAETALGAYLQAYPQGAYIRSARGLLRRVDWLGGRRDKLAAEYAALFALDAPARGLDDGVLADEIDNKLLPSLKAADTSDPILLAVMDLARMRAPAKSGKDTRITPAELEAQRPAFSGNPALFEELLALHAFYVQKQPRAVLGLIPDAARQASFGPLQFSRQMLRGMALEALADRNARGFWADMLTGATGPFQRPALELAIALHEERAGALDKVFAAGSPVRNAAIRAILLANVADAALLRQQAKAADAPQHERDLALFTLLYKEATRGSHADFAQDLALVPADAAAQPTDGNFGSLTGDVAVGVFSKPDVVGDYDCPAFREIQARLARAPQDAKARLCLADFMRVGGYDGLFLDTQPPKTELGGTPSDFPGKPYARLETYRAIIADPKAAAADKAYALYRAVRCYAPAGNNACGGAGAARSERAAWFRRLKQDYPASPWAKDLTYYW
ncbi:hypothetical protein [Labrys wisconsinensis]|uniref:Outer membrane assembly lipoprotein YfiO n=1 Tax=Labrys wisconsinensis TaxID=425677 RepID=A0ABU0J4U7_9HYPH|nr:hypothetical protein [Labrys wisconsinensis]MDQ0468478.1 hypothetical protein [Labrys wisconsinensis]